MRLRCDPDSEVHVWLGVLNLSARANGADCLALLDLGADPDADGTEVDERNRVALLGANRHAESRVRNRPGKRDHSARGCAHVGPRGRPDVDTTVLSAQVRIVLSREPGEHGTVDGPAPGTARRRESKRTRHSQHHHRHAVANFGNHEAGTVTGWSAVVNFGYNEVR